MKWFKCNKRKEQPRDWRLEAVESKVAKSLEGAEKRIEAVMATQDKRITRLSERCSENETSISLIRLKYGAMRKLEDLHRVCEVCNTACHGKGEIDEAVGPWVHAMCRPKTRLDRRQTRRKKGEKG